MRTDRAAATFAHRLLGRTRLANGARNAVLTLLTIVACQDSVTGSGETSLVLRAVAADGVALAPFDQGRIRIEGPTSRAPITVAPGETRTIDGLAPGPYTVALEALTAGDVELFGERSVQVVAGENRTVTITLNSFVPTLNDVTPEITAGQSTTISFTGVTGAAGYTIEYAADPAFMNPAGIDVQGSPATLTLAAEGTYHVRVRALNRFGAASVPSASATVIAGPEIEPLNDHVVYSADGSGTFLVYAVEPTPGAQPIQITNDASILPDLSPDGRRIAFTVVGTNQVALIDVDGNNQVALDVTGCFADWSPDGSRIAIGACQNVPGGIATFAADGSDYREVTMPGASIRETAPRWSPDGSRIVFHSDRDGDYDVYIVDADGTNLEQLTSDAESDLFPSFSPDGTKISWERRIATQSTVRTMNPDGSWQTEIIAGPYPSGPYALYPDWAPNRERMIVNHDGDIHTYRPDGTLVARITTDGNIGVPHWGPCLDASCAPTTGQIEATVATYGSGVDANGFTVTVDGGAGRTANGGSVVTFVGIAPGNHTVAISGLAPNCTLRGDASVAVTVVAGRLAQAPTFEIDCVQVVTNEIVVTPSVVNLGFTGASMTIYGTPFDGSGNPVTTYVQLFFQSTNTSVVTVDANGRITAAGPGAATINITDGFGRSGSVQVNVSGVFGPPTNSLGHTYAITNSAMPWIDAQVHARSTGGYLVSVNDAQENGFLTNVLVAPADADLWIGLYDLFTEDVWLWADGSPSSPGATTPGNGGFASWGADEPNNAGEEDCAHFNAGTAGTWNDLACNSPLRAISEWPGLGLNVITTIGYHEGHRYAITERELTWIEARNLAESLGGRLIVVNDAAENQFITDTFVQPLNGAPFWLGATDSANEGTFGWIDGTPFLFENWAAGEPNEAGDEDCASTTAVQNGQAEWNDVPCWGPRRAIIEWNSLKS